MIAIPAAFLIALALTTSASAIDIYCRDFRPLLSDTELQRPEPPSCLDTLGISDDEFSFDMCRSDVETYRS